MTMTAVPQSGSDGRDLRPRGEQAFAEYVPSSRQQSARSDEESTVRSAFEVLLSDLEPTDAERSKASDQQKHVREQLASRLNLTATFLSGSYRRHTQIRPLDDIDLLVVLDHEHYTELSVATGSSATLALDLIDKALAEAFPHTERFRDDRCIQLKFAGTGIGFDVVPVLQFAEHEFWMPDAARSLWLRTNPREVQRLVSDANQGDADGWLVPLVKLSKAVKDEKAMPLTGYHLEAMVYRSVTQAPRCVAEGVAAVLYDLSIRAQWRTPDIWPQGEDADATLTTVDRQLAVSALSTAAQSASRACELEAEGRVAEAHAIWRDLFGSRYPNPGVQESRANLLSVRDAARVVSAGQPVFATSAGIVSRSRDLSSARTATSHGGNFDADGGEAISGAARPHGLDARLEREIQQALDQFAGLRRVDPSVAQSDPALWPLRGLQMDRLYAILRGYQGTNYGTHHEILVTVPVDMPASEPRVFLLHANVRSVPSADHGRVRFKPAHGSPHHWRDRSICSHAMRDRWDGRLVTILVYAADWLFRREHFVRTRRWIGAEIDPRGRSKMNSRPATFGNGRRVSERAG